MKKYVLGFAFTKDKSEIILIEKQKPDWQKGKLNGVGGKVEPDDVNETDAMIREFREETGVDTSPEQWHKFGTMIFVKDIMGGEAEVYLFRMFDNVVYDCVTSESEQILRVNTDTCLDVFNCMHNLPILIPLALSEEFRYTSLVG